MKHCVLILCCLFLCEGGPVLAQQGCGCGEDDESTLEEGPGCESDEEELRQPTPPKAENKQPPPRRKVERPLQEQINEAIEKGIAFLESRQLKDGSWGPCIATGKYGNPSSRERSKCYTTGPTSFAIFTLAKCGADKKDKAVKRGLRWLRKKARRGRDQTTNPGDHSYSSYESASVVLMLEALNHQAPKRGKPEHRKVSDKPTKPPKGSRFVKDDWKWMHERIRHILECQNDRGGMRYWRRSRKKDLSATQFSLLALRAASRAGYPIDQKHWLWATSYVRKIAASDGSFPYQAGDKTNLGMTAAGIACMVIGKEQMELLGYRVPGWIDPYLKRSFEYLGQNFDLSKKQGGRWHYRYYYL